MKTLNILVVDDEPCIRDFFSNLIEFLGHKSILAENGLAALEHIRKWPWIDLVFLDYKMSGIDGLETFRRIRKINPKIPVVMVTGYAPAETFTKAKREGINGFIRKPMAIREIEEVIRGTKTEAKGKVTILVIDDNPSVLNYFRGVLEKKPIQLETASNAEDAVALLRRQNFHVIFLDVVLPPGEKERIQEEFKKLNPAPKIVLISGHREELNEIREKREMPISGFMYKPFALDEVLKQIELIT